MTGAKGAVIDARHRFTNVVVIASRRREWERREELRRTHPFLTRMIETRRAREVRRATRWRLADVAVELGVDPTTVGSWERGAAFPTEPHATNYERWLRRQAGRRAEMVQRADETPRLRGLAERYPDLVMLVRSGLARELRVRAGLTQAAVAGFLGVPAPYVSMYECGEPVAIDRFARVYETWLLMLLDDELLDGADEMRGNE